MTTPAILYGRVSTNDQADHGHGLDAQRRKLEAYCIAFDLEPTLWLEDAGVSGAVAPTERPGLTRALQMLEAGDARALVVSSLSRLGRRSLDVLAIAEVAREQSWRLVILDVALDTGTAMGMFTLQILAAVGELERAQTIERTKDALAAVKAKGQRLGRPASDETRAAGRRVRELRAAGEKWDDVCSALEAEGFATATGRSNWTHVQARRALRTVQLDDEAGELAAAAPQQQAVCDT